MLEKQQQLYRRICDYQLDDSSHEIGFLSHLIRANGWSRPLALRAIEEYRKFVFLALVADHQVTPSDQVDQVWHLHLLFSDAYWNDFCPRVLGRPLHHHPTRGGQAERDRFHQLYRATLDSYRQYFGEPPANLWPPVDVRFGSDLEMQRGRIRRPFRPSHGWQAWRRWRWTVPMSRLLIVLGVLGMALASAAAATGFDPPSERGDPLLDPLVRLPISITSLIVGFSITYGLLRPLLLKPSELKAMPKLDHEQLAFLSAGPPRVIEVGLASLVRQGVLRADPNSRTLVLIGRIDEAMPGIAQKVLAVYHQLARNASGGVAYTELASLGRYDFKQPREYLQAQKLILKGLSKPIAQWSVLISLILISLQVTELFRPYLPPLHAFLLPFVLGINLGIVQPSGRTLWGDSVLKRYQAASTHADPLQRIALLGSPAMSGGRLDHLRSLIERVEAESSACGC
jgi:uncharacterized protein (TIGR04222 family)